MTATAQLYVPACEVQNIQKDGTCAVVLWVVKPDPVFPPLTLVEGTQVALAIVGCWTLGLCARLYFKAAQQRF